jgi:hypothetical protein
MPRIAFQFWRKRDRTEQPSKPTHLQLEIDLLNQIHTHSWSFSFHSLKLSCSAEHRSVGNNVTSASEFGNSCYATVASQDSIIFPGLLSMELQNLRSQHKTDMDETRIRKFSKETDTYFSTGF